MGNCFIAVDNNILNQGSTAFGQLNSGVDTDGINSFLILEIFRINVDRDGVFFVFLLILDGELIILGLLHIIKTKQLRKLCASFLLPCGKILSLLANQLFCYTNTTYFVNPGTALVIGL